MTTRYIKTMDENQEDKKQVFALVELSQIEMVIIKRIRNCQHGSVLIKKHNGSVTDLETLNRERANFIQEAEGLEVASKIGKEMYEKPVQDNPLQLNEILY